MCIQIFALAIFGTQKKCAFIEPRGFAPNMATAQLPMNEWLSNFFEFYESRINWGEYVAAQKNQYFYTRRFMHINTLIVTYVTCSAHARFWLQNCLSIYWWRVRRQRFLIAQVRFNLYVLKVQSATNTMNIKNNKHTI